MFNKTNFLTNGNMQTELFKPRCTVTWVDLVEHTQQSPRTCQAVDLPVLHCGNDPRRDFSPYNCWATTG